jgi:DDE family transposase
MASLPHIATALQRVLTDVPTALAHDTAFCQRRSKLTAACFVQTLVVGFLAHPQATLAQLTHRAAAAGVRISPQGVAQRFTPSATTLLQRVWEAALNEVVTADPVAAELLAKFPAVILLDSTTIALPDALASIWVGCGGRVAQGSQAALKLTVSLDLVTGTLAARPSDGRAQDKSSPLQHAPLPIGALRITDLGFWSLAVLQEIADGGAYFLSRLHLQTAVLTPEGERLDLVGWLGGLKRRRVSTSVRLGVQAQVAARLVAVRVPHRVAHERRTKLLAHAKREGESVSATKLALTDWTLLVTNAPPDVLAIREALVLARARWQIELLFKLWKEGGRMDEWRSTNPDRILCEVYAKLTAMIIQHWILLISCWGMLDRSLTQAAQAVRDHAVALLLALPSRRAVRTVLATIGCVLVGSRIASRRAKPSLFQLLTDPTLGGLA